MRKNYHCSPKLFLLAFLFFIAFSNCSKSNRCHYTGMPNSFVFLLTENGKRLPDSILTGVKTSYFQNNQKLFLTDLRRGINENGFDAYGLGILSTRLIGIFSADKNIKNYFLEYPDGEQDTLFVDYVPPSPNNNCLYKLNQVRYNGKVILPDQSITQLKVYTLEKP